MGHGKALQRNGGALNTTGSFEDKGNVAFHHQVQVISVPGHSGDEWKTESEQTPAPDEERERSDTESESSVDADDVLETLVADVNARVVSPDKSPDQSQSMNTLPQSSQR